MRQDFEICDIFGFWRENSKYYTYTPRVYSDTYKPRVFSRQKMHPIHPYAKDILKTREWEANEDQR